MNIINIDHIVLTVKNTSKTAQFYESVLGMVVKKFGEGRTALKFGNQKINLYQVGAEIELKASQPTPGAADLCFITDTKLETAMKHVKDKGVRIIEGPVVRKGATGIMISFYFRDPDLNLIEVASYGKI